MENIRYVGRVRELMDFLEFLVWKADFYCGFCGVNEVDFCKCDLPCNQYE